VRDDPALVLVFTGKELSSDEDAQLQPIARSVVVKGVESPERLLDETARFLHRVIGELPQEKQRLLERLHNSDEDIVGKTALLVDDDAPNILALSSVLARREMNVLTSTTGNEAIAFVESTPELTIVLVDMLMPGMDGYQTMQLILANPAFRPLPIIALTAKAMKGDREECLEAGASDCLRSPSTLSRCSPSCGCGSIDNGRNRTNDFLPSSSSSPPRMQRSRCRSLLPRVPAFAGMTEQGHGYQMSDCDH
jgi:CheY-like chemotaxis protein